MAEHNNPNPKANRTPSAAPPAQDRFIEFWQRVYGNLAPMLGSLLVLAVGALIISGGVWGVMQIMEGRREKATDMLSQSLRIYGAELLGDKDTAPTGDEVPRFKTAKERADATLKALDDLNREWSSSEAAQRGLLVRASVLYDQERYDDAAAAYRQFLDKGPKSNALIAQAREGLGLCAEAQNKLDEALKLYSETQGDFYRDRLLLDQARIYLKKNDKKKAIEIYKEIVAKFPTSPIHDDVNNRLMALGD